LSYKGLSPYDDHQKEPTREKQRLLETAVEKMTLPEEAIQGEGCKAIKGFTKFLR